MNTGIKDKEIIKHPLYHKFRQYNQLDLINFHFANPNSECEILLCRIQIAAGGSDFNMQSCISTNLIISRSISGLFVFDGCNESSI